MSDWRNDVSEERPTFAPSTLDPDVHGEKPEMTVRFMDDGRTEDTENGEATVFVVVPLDLPDGATDMSDNEIEAGEEYDLMTSSNRLLYALSEHAENLQGEEAVIQAQGPVKSFDRTYTVSDR